MKLIGFVLLYTVYNGSVPEQNIPTFFETKEECEMAFANLKSWYTNAERKRMEGGCFDTRDPRVREHLEAEYRIRGE